MKNKIKILLGIWIVVTIGLLSSTTYFVVGALNDGFNYRETGYGEKCFLDELGGIWGCGVSSDGAWSCWKSERCNAKFTEDTSRMEGFSVVDDAVNYKPVVVAP